MACVTRPGPVDHLLDVTGLRETLQLFTTPEEADVYVLEARRARAR